MKNSFFTRIAKFHCGPLRIIILLLLLIPVVSHSQAFIGAASVPTDGNPQAGPTPPTVTPPAAIAGDLVIIYGQYRATATTISINNAGGQTWNTATTNSASNQSITIFWCTFNGTWTGGNPSIRVPAGNTNGLSTIMYVFRPTNANTQWVVNVNPVNNTSNATNNVITGVTPTARNSVTMAFWSVANTNTWTGAMTGNWLKTGIAAQYRNTTTGQSHNAVYNIQAAPAATGNITQTQSAGTTALQTIMTWCERPANDLCANDILLTSGTSCVNTTGSVVNATYTPTLNDCNGNTPAYDVWYSFVAQSTNPTITLSLGASGVNFTNPSLELFSGACGGFTSLACTGVISNPGSGALNATGLTIGNTYYIRAYSLTGPAPATNGTFNICVTDPKPDNDECAGAIALTPNVTTCTNITSTVYGATPSAVAVAPCTGPVIFDVWYSFVALNSTSTITISTVGSAINTPRLQLFSGTCGALTSVACGTTTIPATGLTVGATYYVRVYASAGTIPTSNANTNFNICVTYPPPPNDLCTTAIPLTVSANCTGTAGILSGSTYSAGTGVPGCGTANRNDVWYTFVASSTTAMIKLNTSMANPRLTLFSGTCGGGGLTSLFCGNGYINATALTTGATYYVRVYTDPNVVGSFDICVTPISNDESTNALPLTPALACANITGNMYLATPSVSVPVAPCTGPVIYDVWYYFIATANNATVNLSGIGSAINTPRIQIFSGPVGGFTSIACGTTTANATGLTAGNYYYVRVYASAGTPPPSATNAGFSICVTFTPPVATAPANDDCAGAITLPVNTSCGKTMGTVVGATASTPAVATCTGPAAYDVWYKFVATAANININTADFGANFAGTRRIQLLNGTCPGALGSYACGTTSIAATGLTVGATYYIRVYTTTGPAPTYSGDFSICVTTPQSAQRFGNSYVNVTKKTTGGVVEPGDILEIRMTINHTSGTLYALRYLDSVPTNTTMITGANEMIGVITNEGVNYVNYTTAANDDPATYIATPAAGEYNIRMNLGFASAAAGNATGANTIANTAGSIGQMASGDIPKSGTTSSLFATAFRVQVTGVVGNIITLGRGKFIYRTSAGGPDITVTATPYQILITQPMSLCANVTGVNMSEEFGGTFGVGTTLNRPTDLIFPIPGYAWVATSAVQGVGDGQYSIVKNFSPRSGIDRNAERSPASVIPLPSQLAAANRMHGGHWDIDGDHTGTNNSIGNIPTAEGVNAGYMLMVNADYVASETYRQTLTNLCPNTYYEFSAWFRNICPTCGMDYITGSNYTPREPGVKPNLTFALDGLDRYNTGEMEYGDGWVKKGFVFVTGPSQTTATFSIRNNSQGGGGNDWAMDDITVATCLPNMRYSPSLNPTVCVGNVITINDTVTSYFNNYGNYKWQKWSNLTAGPWTDIPGQSGSQTPVLVGGEWRYITSYTIPLADATLANDGDRYRLIVATTVANLSSLSCNVTDGVSIIDVNVIDCTPVLKTDLLAFNGKMIDDKGLLSWTTTNEEQHMKFIVERSSDGRNFQMAGNVNGNSNGQLTNHYIFSDPVSINDKAWYRLAMISVDGKKKYSSIILLTANLPEFDFVKVVNPFSHTLEFDISVNTNSLINVTLLDMSGKTVRTGTQMIYAGTNNLNIFNTESLPAGVYTLRVIRNDNKVITKRVVKTN